MDKSDDTQHTLVDSKINNADLANGEDEFTSAAVTMRLNNC